MCLFFGWQHTSDYKNWDQYRLILSDYETDEDYAKYCDELRRESESCDLSTR
jgi:hypothetical protein